MKTLFDTIQKNGLDCPFKIQKSQCSECQLLNTISDVKLIEATNYLNERKKLSEMYLNQVRFMLENLSNGVILVDSEFKVIYANQSANLMLNADSLLVGKKIHLPNRLNKSHLLKIETGEEYDRFYDVKCTRFNWPNNEIHYCFTLNDVSVYKNLQNKLVETSNLKDEFIANLSHELRTPLNGVVGMVSLLLEQQNSPEVVSGINLIKTSGDNMLKLINDLLDLSKIEAGKFKIERNVFTLKSLLDEIESTFIARLKLNRITLLIDSILSPDSTFIGDISRISQILCNLICNALKFSVEGYVYVEIRLKENGWISFRVEDTGVGIMKENLKDLFKPFSRIQNVFVSSIVGSGLGLSICKQLVCLMGGDISVESEYGKGTSFTFTVDCFSDNLVIEDVGQEKKILMITENEQLFLILKESLLKYNISLFKFVSFDDGMVECDGVVVDKISEPKAKSYQLRSLNVPIINLIPYSEKFRQNISLEFNIVAQPLLIANLVKAIWRIKDLQIKDTEVIANEQLAQHSMSHISVLVAEDNPTNQIVISSMLNFLNIKHKIVQNGLEAVKSSESENFDLIFMDCRMPVMDGFVACEKIKNSKNFGKLIPIIAVTADIKKNSSENSKMNIFDDVLIKPVTIDLIKNCLQKNLRKGDNVNQLPSIIKSLNTLEFDESYMLELQSIASKSRKTLVNDVLKSYFEQVKKCIDELKVQLQKPDKMRIVEIGHRMKGSSRNVGAMYLGNLFQSLELHASSKDFDLERSVVEIEKYFASAEAHFTCQYLSPNL